MNRIAILVCLLVVAGCGAKQYTDAAYVDLAFAVVSANAAPVVPVPDKCSQCNGTGWITHGDGHKTPCPNCSGQSGANYQGPIDTIKGARDLIAKGNALADRGKALLDAAERSGKVTVDIILPKPQSPPPPQWGAPQGGVQAVEGCSDCSGGSCGVRLFGRRR